MQVYPDGLFGSTQESLKEKRQLLKVMQAEFASNLAQANSVLNLREAKEKYRDVQSKEYSGNGQVNIMPIGQGQ